MRPGTQLSVLPVSCALACYSSRLQRDRKEMQNYQVANESPCRVHPRRGSVTHSVITLEQCLISTVGQPRISIGDDQISMNGVTMGGGGSDLQKYRRELVIRSARMLIREITPLSRLLPQTSVAGLVNSATESSHEMNVAKYTATEA